MLFGRDGATNALALSLARAHTSSFARFFYGFLPHPNCAFFNSRKMKDVASIPPIPTGVFFFLDTGKQPVSGPQPRIEPLSGCLPAPPAASAPPSGNTTRAFLTTSPASLTTSVRIQTPPPHCSAWASFPHLRWACGQRRQGGDLLLVLLCLLSAHCTHGQIQVIPSRSGVARRGGAVRLCQPDTAGHSLFAGGRIHLHFLLPCEIRPQGVSPPRPQTAP